MNDTVETTVELVADDGTVTLIPATITSGRDGETAQQETTVSEADIDASGIVFVAEDAEAQPVAYA